MLLFDAAKSLILSIISITITTPPRVVVVTECHTFLLFDTKQPLGWPSFLQLYLITLELAFSEVPWKFSFDLFA